jgi:hypothetical protein
MKNITKLALTLSLFVLSACSGNYYQVPTPPINQSQFQNIGTSTETATGVSLFGFIPIQDTNKLQRAVDSAVSKRGGDAITDLEVRERWYWAVVLNLHKIDVSGTVLKRR